MAFKRVIIRRVGPLSWLLGRMKSYRGIAFVTLLLLAIFAYASLFSGAPYLQIILPGGLPFGNALTAIGLCSISYAAFLITAKRTVIWFITLAGLVASLLWLPVSIALAGNVSLNFSGDVGTAWLAGSAILLLSVVAILLLAILLHVVAWYKRVRAT